MFRSSDGLNTMFKNSKTCVLPQQRRIKRTRNYGAAVVEFAVVGPLMVMLTMGMIEVGRMVMVKQLIVNASREGARTAILPSTGSETVLAQVQQELTNSGIRGAQVTLSPTSIANAAAGTPITVSISIPTSAISWVPTPMFSINQTISASTTMRRESL
jgi:Flp pilus assembly protein TadG